MPLAKLALEDGTVYTGRAFGALGDVDGEVVFNTSMTGYQEILTDPSYHGQIVAMTYPMIGNYGVNVDDEESGRPRVRGFIVRELCPVASNHRSTENLDAYLARHGIPGIEGIDTRALVRRHSRAWLDERHTLRDRPRRFAPGRRRARPAPDWSAATWRPRSCLRPIPTGTWGWRIRKGVAATGRKPHVVAMDFGMKWNIPRHLVETGCRVTVVPGNLPAEGVMDHEPDGIFLSNGPGDPAALGKAVGHLQTLIKTAAESRGIPIFGICLGHQLLGQAVGAKTFKLKFGHRGANHPVRNELTGKVEITTQNHGFAVDPTTLPPDVMRTHINLNDQTLEGLRHARLPVMAVQYHPEASAGPHDSQYLFAEFRRMMA